MQNIYMPFFPISLVQLLASPQFSSHPVPSDTPEETCESKEEQFIVIAKSLMFQVLCAVAFLHDPARKVAHRDIKPANIMLSKEGCVKLIDFGISFKNESDTEKIHDLWPESQDKLYFEVSTGWITSVVQLLFETTWLIFLLEKDPTEHQNFCLELGRMTPSLSIYGVSEQLLRSSSQPSVYPTTTLILIQI